MHFRPWIVLAALAAGSTLGAQDVAIKTPNELKIAGRTYANWVVLAMADSLVAHAATPAMAAQIKADAASTAADIAIRAGNEVALIEERMVKRNKADQYWRIAKYTNLGEPLLIRVVVTPDGKYAGLGIGPLSQAPPIDPPTP